MPKPEGALPRSSAQERADLIEGISYFIELDLTRGLERFGFDGRIEFRARRSGAESFIEAEAESVDLIECNSEHLPNSAWNGRRIQLPGLAQWNSLRVRGEARYDRAGLGLHLSQDPSDGSVYIYADLEPYEAHRVFPCFDQPDLKGSFRFRIRAPQDWVVVSAELGQPEEVDPQDSCRWWSFAPTMPLSPYVIGIAAGPFHEVRAQAGRIPVGLYCARSLVQYLDADEILEVTGQGLDYYERVFRIPYPFSKYDQVFCPEKVNGAMESPGCVTVTDAVLWRGRATPRQLSARTELILHEMAHMWFGDLVTLRWWDDLWLNESFATLMATLAADSATRFRDSWVVLATTFKASARAQDQRSTSHPVANQINDVEDVRATFDRITYEKGASVLRQLVAWVGEDNFFSALRAYLKEHREGNAEFADLVRALELASGRDVAGWVKDWLTTVGVNTLRCEVAGGEPGSGQPSSEVTVVQTATEAQPLLRAHRIRLGLFDWVGEALERVGGVELEVEGERSQVAELSGLVLPPLLLPNDGDLTYAKIRLDPASLRTAVGHLSAVRDELARAVIWDSSWDTVCDAEFPAHRFAQMVAAHVAKESDTTLLTAVLANVRQAIRLYGAPRRAEGLETELCRVAGEALAAVEPGADQQLVWLLAFAGLATTKEQVQRCRDFLEGHDLPSGINLDLELRWSLVQALAARGAVDEAEIAALQATDSSSTGFGRAQAARAARPTAEAKAAAWARLADPQCIVEEARYIALALSGVRHEELLLPHALRLPETFDEIMRKRGAEFTIELGNWLPLYLPPSPELVQRCRENLSRDELDPELRRIFQTLLEDAERRLRARQLDEIDTEQELTARRPGGARPAHHPTQSPKPRSRAAS
jgi:aminopeptidase N